ncbi:MAG: hypothetical protein GF350_05800 [Chitinivibrionales bacterium]|nr:hypothetical protein [Chitinivibrionales bacterium]
MNRKMRMLVPVVLGGLLALLSGESRAQEDWRMAQVAWDTSAADGLLLPNAVAPFERWRSVGACDEDCREWLGGEVKTDGDGRWLAEWAGTLYDVGWVQTQGTASVPLAEWQAVEVGAPGDFHLFVYDAHGQLLLDAAGSDNARYPVSGSGDLVVFYDGPPRAWVVALYAERSLPQPYRQRSLPLAGTSGGRLLYAPAGGQAVYIPAETLMHAAEGPLNPNSGGKATTVCATWEGQADLVVYLLDAGGASLGTAVIPPGRRCGLVYGLVDKPFTPAISSASEVWLWDVEIKGSGF